MKVKKKLLITSLCALLLLTGCQTQEEIMIQKEKERVEEITKEVEENTEIPEEAKQWMIDNRSTKVLTILCVKTSKRCEEIKKGLDEAKFDIKEYYIELDDLNDTVKNVYKTTYELKDYTGYLPYVILVDNNKLVNTKKDIKNFEDLKNFLVENKMVSE